MLDCRHVVRPGVDLVLFGANDLTFSLQASPACPFRSVAECQQHVAQELSGVDVRVAVADLPFGKF